MPRPIWPISGGSIAISTVFSRLLALPSPPSAQSKSLEPLAHLEYARELELKNRALREFWKQNRLPGAPAPIIPSPKPRHYRTTTKRRVPYGKNETSLLEPAEHSTLYAFIGEKLAAPGYKILSQAMNYVIIRGSYQERSVIFNVHTLNAAVVKKLKNLSRHLPPFDKNVVSAFIFFDPTRSEYYLDNSDVGHDLKTKRLFGPEKLFVNFDGARYQFDPVIFSQVNESMVPILLAQAKKMLAPSPSEHLVDLYCGYGLFTHFLAPGYAHACGLEAALKSVEAARHNAKFHALNKPAIFHAGLISGISFVNLLPKAGCHAEALFIDPPRQGMPVDSIAALAKRTPVKVVQACCGIDGLPGQVEAWNRNGYRLAAAAPIDMFAGTPHLETLLRFERAVKEQP